jgi:hypothetical protein
MGGAKNVKLCYNGWCKKQKNYIIMGRAKNIKLYYCGQLKKHKIIL